MAAVSSFPLSLGLLVSRVRRGTATADRRASSVVWTVLVAMTLVVLAHIAAYGHNVPLSEDWNMVPALTGHEREFWPWVWSQNNEHRLPVARLTYLGLLHLTHDFRSGMVFNTLLLAALAAALVLAARRLRGRTSVVDAFFPIAVLHLGHWENLLWGWQLQFVLVTVVVGALLLLLVGSDLPLSPRATLLVAAALVLLPLGGGSGLPMVPAAVAGLFAVVWLPPASPVTRRLAVAATVLAAAVTALYFVGWQPATWYPANPGAVATLRTTAQVMALGWGPAVEPSYRLAVFATATLLGSAAAVLLRGLGQGGDRRRRALALLCVLGGVGLTALAIGYGRAALVPMEGLPDRYALVTLPALLASWFAWELFGPAPARRVVHAALLALVVMLAPLNVAKGYGWRDWYTSGMEAVEADIRAGIPSEVMVERHGDFLMHWNADLLTARMAMLRDAAVGPFKDLAVE